MQGSVLWLILIYSCDLLHRRGTLWGSTAFCTMIEARCEAVSVSICHFVAWLLIFVLSLSICRSVAVFLFPHSFSSYFSPLGVSLSPRPCLFPSQIRHNLPPPYLPFPTASLPHGDSQFYPLFWQFIQIFVSQNRTFMSFQILRNTRTSPGPPFSAHFENIPSPFLPAYFSSALFSLPPHISARRLIPDRPRSCLIGCGKPLELEAAGKMSGKDKHEYLMSLLYFEYIMTVLQWLRDPRRDRTLVRPPGIRRGLGQCLIPLEGMYQVEQKSNQSGRNSITGFQKNHQCN